MLKETTWSVVENLGLAIKPDEVKSSNILIYGSADPLPNPGELLLTQEVARALKSTWRFFVYLHGKNLSNLSVARGYVNSPPPLGIFDLEEIIPPDMTLREMAREIFRLRKEPVIVAHLSSGRVVRATMKEKQAPLITIQELHEKGGWLGGSAIHYFLRLYTEKRQDILYICPFQQKGRVYEIYRGMNRKLFLCVPFVKICPPASMAPNGWEPLPWTIWRALPTRARRMARQKIRRAIENFFRNEEPLRVEIPWRWWQR